MKLAIVIAALVSLSQLANATWNTSKCPNGFEVASGDTIYTAVAGSNYAVTCAWVNYNYQINPYFDPCNLQVTQCIYPPPPGTSTACSSRCNCCQAAASALNTYGNYYGTPTQGYWGWGSTSSCPAGQYAVQQGDTFYKLGGSNGAGMCAWLNANPNVDPCSLTIGKCINQPTTGVTSTQCYAQNSGYYTYPTYSCGFPLPTGSWGTYNGPIGWGGWGGSSGSGTSCNCAAGQYCVQPGDTFCKLAGGNANTACSWSLANNRLASTSLWVGQCINNPFNTGGVYSYQNTYGYNSCGYTC
jgi:hypothetical protein